ncbi:hypothetical protein E2C01_061140 [Portunus trituberculatus]|uniref:Uncharacterized protein n=1 Tax=Portunus trituberculatus TaxID=210409 RepID=A0A5B7H328_PORTR|nr:hypothetical protein [Portunus trituberculatus]
MRRGPQSPVQGATSPGLGSAPQEDAPTWSSLRAKILSFTKGRGKTHGVTRTPSEKRPPPLRSPGPRSPTSRGPRSPTSRSPTSRSPTRSPTAKTPPVKSPTQRFAPPGLLTRVPLTRPMPREAAPAPPEASEGMAGRRALMRRCLKKAFSLNLEVGEGGEAAGSGGGGGGGRKVQLKLKGGPGEQVVELTHLDEDEAEGAAGRKWSFQGGSVPGSPVEVEAPKRHHSFSSAGSEKEAGQAGIVVSSTELAGLLGPRRHLSPPGAPSPPPTPPSAGVPRRGRSQSIAACWDNNQQGGTGAGAGGPQAPITIRRTDCDYESAPRSAPLEAPREEEGEEEEEGRGGLPWEASRGCGLDASLLGSAIEHFLKTTRSEEQEGLVPTAAPAAGLQVK